MYLTVAGAVALATLAGCASSTSTSSSSAGSTSTSSPSSTAVASGVRGSTAPSTSRTQYPVTIEDCGGRKTTYDKAPDRVVTIDPNVAEALLILGLKDKIVGLTQFYSPEQEWAPVKADMDSLKQINKAGNYPSKEAVVAESPDLVTSIYPYAFMDPLPDRDGWTKLGIHSYQTLGECPDAKVTDFSQLYQDLRNFGVMFDVQDKAEAEIAALEARVAEAQQKAKDAGLTSKTIVTADGQKDHPAAYGGTANAVLTLAGARNAFADIPLDRAPSWEEFVNANPDAVWIIPDAGPTAKQIEQQLESDPRTSRVPAVVNKQYVVVPQADATVESPRNVEGLEKMVDGLVALQ